MKFKVGDKVRFKSWEWYEANKDKNGDVVLEKTYFTTGMTSLLGNIFTIKDIIEDFYRLKGSRKLYDWNITNDMLENKAVECHSRKLIDKYDYITTWSVNVAEDLKKDNWFVYHEDNEHYYLCRAKTITL